MQDTWINTAKSTKGIIILALFALLLISLFMYGTYAGLFLILSIMLFGVLTLFWKERKIRILGLTAMVLLCLLNMGINDLKFGIDFSGGTRIPVSLEESVDKQTMNELLDIVKKRASVLGLSEVKVTAVGTSKINIEVPSSNEEQIDFIEESLSSQGIYEGVVDSKVVVTGDDILPGTVQESPAHVLQGADWGVTFTITSEAARNFIDSIEGKANFPLYMFLDRPKDALIVVSTEDLEGEFGLPQGVSVDDILDLLDEALNVEGSTVQVVLLEDLDQNSTLTPFTNRTKALYSSDSPTWLKQKLETQGFVLTELTPDEMRPTILFGSHTSGISLDQWEAVGLLSAPRLNPSITQGSSISTTYSISGSADGVNAEQRRESADANTKQIISILKGGALPVEISLGSKTVLPASLGEEFLRLSFIAIILALLVISIVVGLRYQSVKLILPIVVISISELIILISILGSFTIDLAAMAGIIAAIGVGVDAQIVITDELLKKDTTDLDLKLDYAFQIIKTNVIVAIVAMIPLLFSGLVEVIGFAISTILGALLGYLITRPAYAAIVEDLVEKPSKS